MVAAQALLSFLLAGVLAWLLASRWRYSPRQGAGWALFVLMALAIWAGGLWLAPVGPAIAGVIWLPFLLVALFLALLVASLPLEWPRARGGDAGDRALAGIAGFSAALWILALLLLLVIALGYLF